MNTARAENLAANCFLNAFLLEHTDDIAARESQTTTLLLHHNQFRELHLQHGPAPLCGRTQFYLPASLIRSDGSRETAGFIKLATVLITENQAITASTQARQLFMDRLMNSLENIETVLAARDSDIAMLFQETLTFIQSEQSLLCGHSVHPLPKTREGFTDSDSHSYAPEFGSHFQLHMLAAHKDIIIDESAETKSAAKMVSDLIQNDSELHLPETPPKDYLYLPCHPFQWRCLEQNPIIADYLQKGLLLDLGPGGRPWSATSSLRAVWSERCAYMLKFSLTVRITNSIRHLTPWEAYRGKQVTQALKTPVGQAFQEAFPHFQLITEPAFLALRDPAGEMMAETIVVLRENPFSVATPGQAELLAGLCQDHPDGKLSRLAEMTKHIADEQKITQPEAAKLWFRSFFEKAVKPLLAAQSDYGLLFGAHQQNLLLQIEDNLPVGAYYRDCQGTGYSPLGHEQLLPYLPELGRQSANVVDGETGKKLFVYYLFINSVFNVVACFHNDGLLSSDILLTELRELLQDLRESGPRDTSVLDYLLDSPQLWFKGNYRCNLEDLNENTCADPLAIYQPIDNPLIAVIRCDQKDKNHAAFGSYACNH